MTRWRDMVSWQTLSGRPLTVGGIRVTPQAWALVVRLPRGGFVWNRPLAVLVEQDGSSRRIPILDVTRAVQIGLAGLGIAISVLSILVARDRPSR
jgi:hypothetical protein